MIDGIAVCRGVRFEFLGGPHDGLMVAGTFGGPDMGEGDGLLWRTDGGRPGTEFWLPSEYAISMIKQVGPAGLERLAQCGHRFHGHRYEVITRQWRNDLLVIRSRHLGYGE